MSLRRPILLGFAALTIVTVVVAHVRFDAFDSWWQSSRIERPARTKLVFDKADLLTSKQEQTLARQLAALDVEVGPQLAVVTVSSLEGKDVLRFTDDLGNRLEIGDQDASNGVILLIAPNERKARISYANGLKGKLTDAFCDQVMQEILIPRFRSGDFAGGIAAGVNALDHELRRLESSTGQLGKP